MVSLTRNYDLYHVTGINLAMLMNAIVERDDESSTTQSVSDAAMEAAADSFADVRKILLASNEEGEEDL